MAKSYKRPEYANSHNHLAQLVRGRLKSLGVKMRPAHTKHFGEGALVWGVRNEPPTSTVCRAVVSMVGGSSGRGSARHDAACEETQRAVALLRAEGWAVESEASWTSFGVSLPLDPAIIEGKARESERSAEMRRQSDAGLAMAQQVRGLGYPSVRFYRYAQHFIIGVSDMQRIHDALVEYGEIETIERAE